MLKKEKIIFGLALIILSISMITVQSEGQSEAFEHSNQEVIEANIANGISDNYLTEIPLLLNYTLHEPILVTNDEELAEIASNGTGTENDPLIISGWNFNYSEEAVFISGTTVYFVIKECLFKSNTSCIPYSGGIRLENIANETELGTKAKSFMDAGKLVPDEIVLDMLFDRVASDDSKNGYLLVYLEQEQIVHAEKPSQQFLAPISGESLYVSQYCLA